MAQPPSQEIGKADSWIVEFHLEAVARTWHTQKKPAPSSANGQESTSADVAVATASVDSGRAYGPQYPPKHVAGLRCTGLMLEMHRNFPRLSAKIEAPF